MLQGTTFAVICTKLLSPRTNLHFSKSCCAYTRDDKLMLTFRVCHPQGHYCCVNDVSCVWMHGETTGEGEKYVAATPIEFNFPSHLYTPVTVTHTVDESSPFWEYRDDLCETYGQIRINVSGLDKALETDFCDSWVYNCADICHSKKHRWADVYVDSTKTMHGGRVADLGKLDEVRELD